MPNPVYIPTGDLVGILADVIPFAFPDEDLPALNCVHVWWNGRELQAETTDRYRIAISRWLPGDMPPRAEYQPSIDDRWGGPPGEWSCVLALAEAREIVSVFKLPPKFRWVELAVDRFEDEGTPYLTVTRDARTGWSDVSMMVRDREDDLYPDNGYPDLGDKLSEAADGPLSPLTEVAYRASYLADFAKVRNLGPLRMWHHPTMTRVAIGGRFRGAIRPLAEDREDD